MSRADAGRLAGPRLRRALATLAVLLVAGLAPARTAAAAVPPEPQLDADAWLLVDARDDARLAARQPHASLPVASATKLMTAYLSLRELRLDEQVTAAPYDPLPAESLMGLRPGESATVRDLLYGLLLASGNDAAVTLAEGVSGSVSAFVGRMNRTAARLGLADTSYSNPIGLDDPSNYSSAADLVRLSLDLREDPTFRRIVDTPAQTVTSGSRSLQVVSRNMLVRTVPWVSGIKTGHTLGAGYVLVGSAKRKGVTLVSALLGAPSEAARDAETLELLRYGLSLYRRETALNEGERLASTDIRYRDEAVPLVAGRSVELTARRDQDVEARAVRAPSEVEGPIERGERLGAAVVTLDGRRVDRLPLLAKRSASAATFIDRVDSALPGQRLAAWGLLALAALLVVIVLAGLTVAVARRRRSAW